MRSLLTLILASTNALAEPATIESGLRELATPSIDGGRGLHARAFAQVASGSTGDSAESGGAVGGELRYRGRRCDAIRIGGQARFGWSDTARTRGEQWASFCIPVTVLKFGHHLEWDVRPSLLAPLRLRAGENRRETLSFHWQPLRTSIRTMLSGGNREKARENGHEIAEPEPERESARIARLPRGDASVFEIKLTSMWLLAGATTSFASREHLEVTMLGYIRDQTARWGERRDLTVDAFVVGGQFAKDGATVDLWLARIQNAVLGPLFGSAAIGFSTGGAGPYNTDPDASAGREIDVTKPAVRFALETGRRRFRGALRFTQELAIAPDGYLTYDKRLAGELAALFGKTRVGFESAYAITEVRTSGALPVKALVGGAALRVGHPLAKRLQAMLQVEGARSFYGANVAMLDFRPRWGVNAFGGLQMSVGK